MYEDCDTDGHDRKIEVAADEAMKCIFENLMEVNIDNIKGMVVYFGSKELDVAQIIKQGRQIERVAEFKLLGIIFNNRLTWDGHVDYICQNISTRLYFRVRSVFVYYGTQASQKHSERI